MKPDSKKTTKEIRADLEAQFESAVEEVRRTADPDVVEEVEAELRREFEREIKARIARTVKLREAERRAALEAKPKQAEEEFVRFTPVMRAQHIVLMASCIVLIITGLPLKFPDSGFAHFFFTLLGGVTASGTIHRVGAVCLIGVGLFHLGWIAFAKRGRSEFVQLIPKPKDILDVIHNISYFLGRSKHGARFGRFSYIEKFDYWAVYWGMVVMIGSGLMLWGQDIAMALVPKFFLDMAKEAHSDEALLATLAIIVWHFYNVHLNPDNFPMSKVWLTGKLSKEQMLHHHPVEYEQIMAGRGAPGGNGKRKKTASDESFYHENTKT